jgi:hypothetical protein
MDRRGICEGEDWKARLRARIRDADTVVFVLSSSSAESDICARKVAGAIRLGKRIIPLVCRALESAKRPQELVDRDYIYFHAPRSGFVATTLPWSPSCHGLENRAAPNECPSDRGPSWLWWPACSSSSVSC